MTDYPTREENRSINGAKKILVVDDDVDSRQLLQAVFERYSYEADEAEDTSQALEKIQSWQPDLVITDVLRPDSSGLDLLRLVKNCRPSLPVVVVECVDVNRSYREMCLAGGAAALIDKPFDPEQLIEVISKVLARSHRG